MRATAPGRLRRETRCPHGEGKSDFTRRVVAWRFGGVQIGARPGSGAPSRRSRGYRPKRCSPSQPSRMGYFDGAQPSRAAHGPPPGMGAAFATFAPASGRCPVMTSTPARRRRVRGRPCLRRPALASPSRRRHGARDHAEGRLRAHLRQTSAGTRAAGLGACRGASACVWAFDLAILHLCGMVHPGLRFVARHGRAIRFSACELRRQSLAVARASREAALSRAKPSGSSWDATTAPFSRRAGRRARRRGNGGGERERRRHRAAFLPYDRGAPLGMAYKAVNTS